MSSSILTGTMARGFYPERQAPDETALDRAVGGLWGRLEHIRRAGVSRFRNIIPATNRHEERFRRMSRDEIGWQVAAMRRELRAHGFGLERAARVFALVREVSMRSLEMRHFDVQILGGWVLLNGMVAEMQTGEGKTLTATLPAAAVALAGIPVHVITVNDYLAQRDAEWMGPVYRALGLSVGTIIQGMDVEERRRAYRCDVTYCTNKEIVFDYLRDRLDMGRRPGPIQRRLEELSGNGGRLARLRLRGLCYAIVDEADSVLIDEARTPLIISGRGDNSYEALIYRQALELSRRLQSEEDYVIDFPRREVELTEVGKAHLESLGKECGGFWNGRLRREEMVHKALTARHLFHRDKHYVIKEGKVQIVDEYTGRIMPSRSWEGGLHQLIETKEECEVTAQTEVMGRISYQRFFRRYLALSGMTGTAREGSREFWSVYRLKVVTVPTNKPLRRHGLRSRIFSLADEKWAAVVARIQEMHHQGRPVLIGTRTVADSERLAALLAEAGLPCRVLNALQDRAEAEIIAQAGQRSQITVATNMAGRGTDIKLDAGVEEMGGLHVMATERHDAHRIDRQLFGRCGRHGEPGTFEAFVSLEDELLKAHPAPLLGLVGPDRLSAGSVAGRWLSRLLIRNSQRAAERRHFHMRRDLLKLDESLDSALAFSGRGE
jgi:preprotein translocase subunit SecA